MLMKKKSQVISKFIRILSSGDQFHGNPIQSFRGVSHTDWRCHLFMVCGKTSNQYCANCKILYSHHHQEEAWDASSRMCRDLASASLCGRQLEIRAVTMATVRSEKMCACVCRCVPVVFGIGLKSNRCSHRAGTFPGSCSSTRSP